MVRSSLRLSLALLASTTLSACILFPPFFGLPMGEQTLVVENATDEDWVLSVTAPDYPITFAIPAGETGEVALYGGAPTTVQLLDLECADVADLPWDESFTGVRIGPDATLSGLEEAVEEDLTTFVEYFECGFGAGQAPEAGDPLPDGTGTILVAGGDGSGWALNVATAELAALSSGETFGDMEHTWSADGTRMAFSRFSDSGMTSVHIAAADGTDERLLIEDAATPAWSPDGTRLAYLSTDPFAGASALSVVDVETGERIELADEAVASRWSPDGTRIAFISGDPTDFGTEMPLSELRVVNADGTGLETLAEATPFASAPAWSPDGTLIAFMAAPNAADGGDPFSLPSVIAVYDLGTGEVRTVAEIQDASAAEPAWSPDGTRLAFTVSMFGMFHSTGSLGLVSADGGDVEQIGTLEDAYYASPVWSPDGAWIATARSVGPQLTSSLVAVPAAGGEEVILASGVTYAAAWRAADER